MKRILVILTGVFILLASTPLEAYIGLCCSHCGGNMPLNIVGGGIPEAFEWRVKVSSSYMNMDGLRDGTDDLGTSELLGLPSMGKYMAVPTNMEMYMTNLSIGYSFSDDFAAMLMFMYGYKEMDMRFNKTMKMMLGRDDFTMESEGMADTMLLGKYRLYADDEFAPTNQVSLLLGVSMPTGSINEKFDRHPDKSQNGNTMPYSMQMGSGTFDPTLGILYQGSADPSWWGANLQYTARLYDNQQGYHLGDALKLDLYGMYQVRYDTVLHMQLNGSYQQAISGEMDEAQRPYTTPLYDPDNYGGHKVAFTMGIQWQPVPLHIADLSFSMPIYQDLHGPQLKDDYHLMLTYYIEIPSRVSRRYISE